MAFFKFIARALIGLGLVVGAAQAQQPLRLVVPFAAGGGTDQYVRLLASELAKKGTPVIVENKPGASGIVAADYVARARPDGLTLLVSSLGTLASNTVLFEKLPYDPKKDLAPVTQIAYQPAIVVGRPDLPYRNISEMVAFARANPGKINRGSPGEAILTNLAPLGFERSIGISTTHVPFNGDSPAIQGLLSGTIDIDGTSITSVLSLVQSGKLRVLGVMDGRRLPQMPDAPTFKEQGFDFEALLWYSLSAPAGTPAEAVMRLHKAVNQVIADPAFVTKARAMGMEPRGSASPQELAKFVQAEHERWVPLLQSLNLPKQH